MKKEIIYIIFALFITYPSVVSGESQLAKNAFAEGTNHYKEGNYEEALEDFLEAEKTAEGFAINFNIGNTYFKLNQIPESILHYERALKYQPANEDLLYNLRLANDRIVDKIETLPRSKLNRWWREFRYGMGPDGWGYIALAWSLVSAFLLFVFFYSRRRGLKRLGFYGGIIGLILMVLSTTLAKSADAFRNTHNSGVVFTDKVDVKGEPREESTLVFVLHAGTKVTLVQQVEDWYEVELASGNRGWMKADDLEEI
ncbi:MAG TPA: tetratricopeptide repeat protein [Cryomorphaceae bacterium]|nr:tetratricopeptide repeat protein [Cryomorphaceae bacterium]